MFDEIQSERSRKGHDTFNRAGEDEFEVVIKGFKGLEAIRCSFTSTNGVGAEHTLSELDGATDKIGWITR